MAPTVANSLETPPTARVTRTDPKKGRIKFKNMLQPPNPKKRQHVSFKTQPEVAFKRESQIGAILLHPETEKVHQDFWTRLLKFLEFLKFWKSAAESKEQGIYYCLHVIRITDQKSYIHSLDCLNCAEWPFSSLLFSRSLPHFVTL